MFEAYGIETFSADAIAGTVILARGAEFFAGRTLHQASQVCPTGSKPSVPLRVFVASLLVAHGLLDCGSLLSLALQPR
jgi:hypothetical protein